MPINYSVGVITGFFITMTILILDEITADNIVASLFRVVIALCILLAGLKIVEKLDTLDKN